MEKILKNLFWRDVLLILCVLVLAKLITFFVQGFMRWLAEKIPSRLRLSVLRMVPFVRLLIGIGTVVIIVPVLVEPTFQNIATVAASLGLALAYTLKDYGSSFAAGWVSILENVYQPGDWIEVDGTYGEVKSIRARATRIVTADDNEITIPHSHLWSKSISNATSGNRRLLCVTDFYLHPDHDAVAARNLLTEIAKICPYREPESPVVVIVLGKPWGTHYRVKVHVHESREQFLLMSDIMVRGTVAIRSLGIRFAQAPYAETQH